MTFTLLAKLHSSRQICDKIVTSESVAKLYFICCAHFLFCDSCFAIIEHLVSMNSILILATLAAAALATQVPLTVYTCKPPFCDGVPPNLTGGVMGHAAPGIVIGAMDSPTGPPLIVAAAGRYTYESWDAEVTNETLWDMASCSKIMATTTAAAILYQRGLLDLDEQIASPRLLGPDFASQGKGEITVRNCMLHNAGFPGDPNPGYSSPIFPCPQNAFYHPGQEFSCDGIILDNLMFNQTLINVPGEVFVYSDLSMITMMFAIGKLVRDEQLIPATTAFPPVCNDRTNLVCNFNAFVQIEVFDALGMTATSYVPTNAELTPPEWNDPWYHHELIKGYVSDQNAYALGGVAGHAGVFTNIEDAMTLMSAWLFNTHPEMINATTTALWTKVANLTQSSRALGWDTNDQSYRWCGTFGNRTFLHIGYTGTELCADPELGVLTVVLANGRYPYANSTGMIAYRPAINALLHDLYVSSTSLL
jgi:serine-type D-Ala-D-Ala carboxypeptidase